MTSIATLSPLLVPTDLVPKAGGAMPDGFAPVLASLLTIPPAEPVTLPAPGTQLPPTGDILPPATERAPPVAGTDAAHTDLPVLAPTLPGAPGPRLRPSRFTAEPAAMPAPQTPVPVAMTLPSDPVTSPTPTSPGEDAPRPDPVTDADEARIGVPVTTPRRPKVSPNTPAPAPVIEFPTPRSLDDADMLTVMVAPPQPDQDGSLPSAEAVNRQDATPPAMADGPAPTVARTATPASTTALAGTVAQLQPILPAPPESQQPDVVAPEQPDATATWQPSSGAADTQSPPPPRDPTAQPRRAPGFSTNAPALEAPHATNLGDTPPLVEPAVALTAATYGLAPTPAVAPSSAPAAAPVPYEVRQIAAGPHRTPDAAVGDQPAPSPPARPLMRAAAAREDVIPPAVAKGGLRPSAAPAPWSEDGLTDEAPPAPTILLDPVAAAPTIASAVPIALPVDAHTPVPTINTVEAAPRRAAPATRISTPATVDSFDIPAASDAPRTTATPDALAQPRPATTSNAAGTPATPDPLAARPIDPAPQPRPKPERSIDASALEGPMAPTPVAPAPRALASVATPAPAIAAAIVPARDPASAPLGASNQSAPTPLASTLAAAPARATAPSARPATKSPVDRATPRPIETPAPPPRPAAQAAAAILPAFQAFGAALHRAATADRRPVAFDPDLVVSAISVVPAAAPAFAQLAPVDTTQPRWPEAVMTQLDQFRDARGEWRDATDTRIRLHPDALGPIDVALRREGEAVHIQLRAAEPATRALLADAQPRLHELATERGLRLGGSDVGAGTAQGNAQGWSNDRRQPAPAPGQPLSNRRAAAEPDVADDNDRLA